MTRKASCCCGACSVEVQGEPDINAICHCNNCKRRTGSAFGWSAYFGDDRMLDRRGDFRVYAISGDNPQRRWFCAVCGSTVLWKSAAWPHHTGIAGGCFVDPPLPEPTVTVSNAGRCPWLGLPGEWRTSL